MNRTEFILITALVLFVVFMLGWFANWVMTLLTRGSKAELSEFDKMVQAVHEAEDMRDKAIAHMNQREAELTSRLSQSGAELQAAMDGLSAARREAEELRAYIERLNQGAD